MLAFVWMRSAPVYPDFSEQTVNFRLIHLAFDGAILYNKNIHDQKEAVKLKWN